MPQAIITILKDKHDICDVILGALNDVIHVKALCLKSCSQEGINKHQLLYDYYLLTSGNPLSAKGWAEKYLLTILETIIVLFFTVSEKSGKKHSVIPVEFWENIDTKDLQAHFNYPKGQKQKEKHILHFPISPSQV